MPDQQKTSQQEERKNIRTLAIILTGVVGMIALSFAAVPLYDLFCRVTGYGGTTQVSEVLPDTVSERTVEVFFDARTHAGLPWRFKPNERRINIQLGEKGITSYTAVNRAGRPTGGTAIYNVTPAKAGQYFHKIQCFCFERQILNPGQKANMPLLFFVDPAMAEDPALSDVSAITLTYTFFPDRSEAWEEAMEDYINRPAEEISPMGPVE